jgi:hypothetical protein
MINQKIICFTDSFNNGGAQKQMIMLANGLAETQDVKTLQYHDLNFLSKFINPKIEQNKILNKNIIIRILKILLFLNKEKPDVIISFLIGPNNYAALYKIIFFWNKTTLIVGERNLNVGKLNFKDFLKRFSHLFANYVVCNSNAQKKKLSRFFKNKLIFIPNGTKITNSKVKKIDSYLNKVNFKLIVPARFIEQKNPLGLIKAIKNFKNVNVYWYGEVFKEYPIYFECTNYIKKNKVNNFYFMESVDNIHDVLLDYDALILPSFYEGCPNAIIDAMYVGLPILASDVSDNRIYLDHQRELIFNPNDVDDIKSKISNFISLNISEIEFILNTNPLKARGFFDVKIMIDNYLKLIK